MIDDAFRDIESFAFRFSANQAGDVSSFRRLVLNEPVVTGLLDRLTDNDSSQIVQRIHVLCNLAIDDRYEHPDDSAIATYLVILDQIGSTHAVTAADIVSKTQQLWWARKIASQTLIKAKRKTTSTNKVITLQKFSQYLYATLNSRYADENRNWFLSQMDFMIKLYFLTRAAEEMKTFKATSSTQFIQFISTSPTENYSIFSASELIASQGPNNTHDTPSVYALRREAKE
jgi:hypothetical protein